MRELTFDDIKKTVEEHQSKVEQDILKLRQESKENGWSRTRRRPRNPDEVRSLDTLTHNKIHRAMDSGRLKYDEKARVFWIADFNEGKD